MRLRRQSLHHSITVEDRGGVRTMQFGDIVQSTMRIDGHRDEGLEYADFIHIATLLRGAAGRVLLIGLGGATVPKQFLDDYPDLVIDVVEIDGTVIALAREHFGFITSDRCSVHEADGRSFIEESTEVWDLIILDAYTIEAGELSLPAGLIGREFFERCGERLAADGIVAFNCAAAASNQLTRRVRDALASVFPHGLIFESATSDNSLLLASRAPLEQRADRLVELARKDPHTAMVEKRSLVRRCRQLAGTW